MTRRLQQPPALLIGLAELLLQLVAEGQQTHERIGEGIILDKIRLFMITWQETRGHSCSQVG
jgi:hypothetical protein